MSKMSFAISEAVGLLRFHEQTLYKILNSLSTKMFVSKSVRPSIRLESSRYSKLNLSSAFMERLIAAIRLIKNSF